MTFTKQDLEKLNRLIRRRDWLRERSQNRKASAFDTTYDDAEESALTWAIELIKKEYENFN